MNAAISGARKSSRWIFSIICAYRSGSPTVLNECGYFTQPRALRSAVPARTHDDDVSAILIGTAKQDGLQHAMLANRLRKLIQFLFAEVAAWLIGVFVNAVDRDQKRPPGCRVPFAATSASSLKLRSSVISRLLIEPFYDLGENRADFPTRFLRRAALQTPHRHAFRHGFGIAVACNNLAWEDVLARFAQ